MLISVVSLVLLYVMYSRTLVDINADDPQLDCHVRGNSGMVMKNALGTVSEISGTTYLNAIAYTFVPRYKI